MRINKLSILLFAVIAMATSCKKEVAPDPTPTPTPISSSVPTSYNFTNVNFAGQTTRLTMLDSISNYMKNGNNGATLNATTMKNMYANTGNPFNNSTLDASGKQLKDKTYLADQAYFDNLFDSLALASQSAGSVGSNGVAGIVTSSANSSKKYLLDRNGVEYPSLIKKQLMGAIFYYQAIETYLANLPSDDNSVVVTGNGTAMEHHCDEAFGYFGVPVNFPANLSGLSYWGSYSNQVNAAIGSNTALMNAFLNLRYAISTKDNATRDAQIITVREQWERIVAASAIHEMSEAKTNFADDAVRNHVLSEAIGFINALKYNSNKKISQTQIDAAIAALGTNLYNISTTAIDNSITIINSVYNFDLNKF